MLGKRWTNKKTVGSDRLSRPNEAQLTRFAPKPTVSAARHPDPAPTANTFSEPRYVEREVVIISGSNEASGTIPLHILKRALPDRFERIGHDDEGRRGASVLARSVANAQS